MSLLMDALRRAEQEKKAAADKLKEKEDSLKGNWADTEGLSLIPEDDNDNQKDGNSVEDEKPGESGDVSHSIDPDATLAEARESLDLAPEREKSGKHPDAINMSPESVGSESNHDQIDDHYNLSLEDDDKSYGISDSIVSQDQTHSSAGPHSVGEKFTIDMSGEAGEQTLSSDQDNTNNTFILENQTQRSGHDKSTEYEVTLEQTRTYSESTGNNQLTGEKNEQKTRNYSAVAAQNVFAAKRNKSQTALTVVILILLIAIGLTAAGFFYYYSVTPVTRQIVSPRVAENISGPRESTETISPENISETLGEMEPLPPPIAETPDNESIVTDESNGGIDSTVKGNVDDVSSSDNNKDTQVNDGKVDHESKKQALSGNEALNDRSAEASISKTTTQSLDTAGLEDVAEPTDVTSDELELRPSLIKISRSREKSTANETVTRAYQAYTRGELEQARRLYGQVLDSSPNNRNALLGLGAIAMRLNNLDTAFRYYGNILQQNPSDRIAQAALVTIQKQSNPANSEARIKRLIEAEPDAAYLYQALGHVYARTQRWPQAQQAYFNAYTHDSDNADYAYNLAVSLDQLNQGTAALKYYDKALEMSPSQPISFDRDTAQTRVNQIKRAASE